MIDVTYLKQMKVLVVDDEPAIITAMRGVLESHVLELKTALDGKEGFSLFLEFQPDIVLSDIQMPHWNGITLAEKIKENDEDVEVLLVTAFGDEHYLLQALEAGVDAYIKKPVTPIRLLKRLEDIAAGKAVKKAAEHEKQMALQNMLIRSKVEIIQDVAHHWRQPINTVNILFANLVDYIEMDLGIEDKLVRKDIKKLQELIQETSSSLLRFQNLYQKTDQEYTEVNLNDLFSDVLKIFEVPFREVNLKLNYNVDESLTLPCLESHLNEMMVALIKNTLDAKEQQNLESAELRISAEQIDKDIVITVSDNCGGVESEIIDSLFEPYTTTKFKKSGTGLSLFFVKGIIETQLNGTIGIENTDVGARFTIKLPMERDEV